MDHASIADSPFSRRFLALLSCFIRPRRRWRNSGTIFYRFEVEIRFDSASLVQMTEGTAFPASVSLSTAIRRNESQVF